MDKQFDLLTKEQTFGEHQIDVIRALGTTCEATDFAMLLGAPVSEINTEGDRADSADPAASRKGSFGKWFLSSAAGYGDVCVVNADGTASVAYASAKAGIRPVLPCSDSEILDRGASRKDISGFLEVDFGEYPQDAADKETARTLESDYQTGTLARTGKTYEAIYDEYIAADKKYIRAENISGKTCRLSDGRICRPGQTAWLAVEPVKWLWDEAAQLLVSRCILAFGTGFCAGNDYGGNFEETKLCKYLRSDFAQALIPSQPHKLTKEEQEIMQDEMQAKAKKRNPYGFDFGQVSEEDIIRGAIESDIAVFLHGPSSEGKSARIKQIDPTCEIIYLRNATPDSLNGRSVYNQETGEMIDIPPTWYKKVVRKCEEEPEKLHVVFFDEINNALPSIQGMAFNIVLDREVNGLWKLPANARVVAAGNDTQDSLAANQIAAPFFNRFAHVYINTTTEKWLRWARKYHIHPAIYSYIAFKSGETLRSKYDGEKPNADPRKWEMASKMLYATGQPEMLRSLIGEEITEEFVQFCNQPVITLERVLKEDYTEEEIDSLNTAQRYATTMGLSQAEDKDVETVRQFVGKLGEEFRSVFDDLWATHGSKEQ